MSSSAYNKIISFFTTVIFILDKKKLYVAQCWLKTIEILQIMKSVLFGKSKRCLLSNGLNNENAFID